MKKIENELIAVTNNVKRLIYDIPKMELAILLKISRPTLDKKIKSNDWTYREKLIIDSLIKKS